MKKKTELSFNYNNKKYSISGDAVYSQNNSIDTNKIPSVEIKNGKIILKDKDNKSKILNSKTPLEEVVIDFARIKSINFNDDVTKSLIDFSTDLAKNYNTTPEGLEFMEIVAKVLTYKKNNYNLILENNKKIDEVYNRLNKNLKLKVAPRKSSISTLKFKFNNLEYQIDGNNLYTGKSEKPYVRVAKIEYSDGEMTYENSDSKLEFGLDKELSAEKALTLLGRVDSEFYNDEVTESLIDYSKDMAYKYNSDPSNSSGVEFITSAEKVINYKRSNYTLINKNNIEIEGVSDSLLNVLVTGTIQNGNQSGKETNQSL